MTLGGDLEPPSPGVTRVIFAEHVSVLLEEGERLGGRLLPVRPGAISERDADEFVRTFSRADGFRGARRLYASSFTEAPQMQKLAGQHRLQMPVLAVGAGGGDFTAKTTTQVAEHVTAESITNVGHFAALEAPETLARTLLEFYRALGA